MRVESRLHKLEETAAQYDRTPIHILREIVDPDPAIGVVSMIARLPGLENQHFNREPGESVQQMTTRVCALLGWEEPA